jgi:ArsR family transcriptional regulator, arsenate/arsenite/antimonite-responsive transcriptional repressor
VPFMDQERAIEGFAALAHASRMGIVKLLVRQGPTGLRVSNISQCLNITPSTLSGHLAVLRRAGLIKARRQAREIHYSADLETISSLVAFLLSDCCHGEIGNCSEIISLLSCNTATP